MEPGDDQTKVGTTDDIRAPNRFAFGAQADGQRIIGFNDLSGNQPRVLTRMPIEDFDTRTMEKNGHSILKRSFQTARILEVRHFVDELPELAFPAPQRDEQESLQNRIGRAGELL